MIRGRLAAAVASVGIVAATAYVPPAAAQDTPPLSATVNDFAGIIDAGSASALDRLVRSLQQASGDVVIVATVDSIEPFADIQEYAVRMFENGGRGIGERGRDNGLLVLVAVRERQVRIEVGYELEQFITDGFAGETVRRVIAPAFRDGAYGDGLVAGVSRLVQRIAQGRGVVLEGVQLDRPAPPPGTIGNLLVTIILLLFLINAVASTRRRRPRGGWGTRGWSGWNSGVGPFGGPFGGGFGGFGGGGFGGGGGGFGGFGGGRSGGGGGGGGW